MDEKALTARGCAERVPMAALSGREGVPLVGLGGNRSVDESPLGPKKRRDRLARQRRHCGVYRLGDVINVGVGVGLVPGQHQHLLQPLKGAGKLIGAVV